jgi:hypothetical protein
VKTLIALRDPLLKKRNKSGWSSAELLEPFLTRYRDLVELRSPCGSAATAKTIQTLKTSRGPRGPVCRAQRIRLPGSQARPELDGDCWPASLAELDKKQLKAIFSTDFVRERAEIAWGKTSRSHRSCLDSGHGKHSEEICESPELRQVSPLKAGTGRRIGRRTLSIMLCNISIERLSAVHRSAYRRRLQRRNVVDDSFRCAGLTCWQQPTLGRAIVTTVTAFAARLG